MRTYLPAEAIKYAKHFVKGVNLDEVSQEILNTANFELWMAAPWRWTISSMPAITLAANTSDYSVAHPADYLYALDCVLADGQKSERPIEIVASIPPNLPLVGQPSRIAFMGVAGATGTVRIAPKQASVPGTAPTFITNYKRATPRLSLQDTSDNLLPFDDEWFHVYREIVLYQAYLFANDRRAGDVAMVAGQPPKFSGQRAVYEAATQRMREREKLQDIDGRAMPDRKAGN